MGQRERERERIIYIHKIKRNFYASFSSRFIRRNSSFRSNCSLSRWKVGKIDIEKCISRARARRKTWYSRLYCFYLYAYRALNKIELIAIRKMQLYPKANKRSIARPRALHLRASKRVVYIAAQCGVGLTIEKVKRENWIEKRRVIVSNDSKVSLLKEYSTSEELLKSQVSLPL